MARFDVPYGGGRLSFAVPDARLSRSRARIDPSPEPVEADPTEFAARIAGARRLLVVVNDGFRPTPTQELLSPFTGALADCAEVRFVVATGMHPPPSAAEIERLLGPHAASFAVFAHSEASPLTDFGTLTDGTRLELNSLLEWAETILLVGSVEPHFFAGFTGGLKQILPGLASRAAIEANHRHAVHPMCRPLQLEGNPVAQGILEAGERFAARVLSIQAVAGPGGWESFHGSEPDTFTRAAHRARSVAELTWEEPQDGLIVVMGSPLDRNLYQLQKGFENHLNAVRDGGWILLVSACADGVGNNFFGRLAHAYPDFRRLPPWETQSYSLGLHKLYRTAAARERCELFLTSQLPEDVVRSVYLEPVADLPVWLSHRCERARAVGVVERADRTVSTVRPSSTGAVGKE